MLGMADTPKYYLAAVEAAEAIAWAWGNVAVIANSNDPTALKECKVSILPAFHYIMKYLFVNFHFMPMD